MGYITIRGHTIFGGQAEGEALVSEQGISLYGSVDYETGIVTERRHVLRGRSLRGKVLVFPFGKGSTGWARALFCLKQSGNAPKALISRELCEFVVIGAVTSEIPAISCFDLDPVKHIKDGDYLRVDADKGIVRIICRKQ